MKKTFVALLISASLVACGKKESTTPVNKEQPEQKDDATGGARYGGHKNAPAPKDAPAPNPGSPK
ncbi:MAG TPA: hypothetical protein VIX73_34125 [Kofleriaceae bacterium]|jgi:hypothetical protein